MAAQIFQPAAKVQKATTVGWAGEIEAAAIITYGNVHPLLEKSHTEFNFRRSSIYGLGVLRTSIIYRLQKPFKLNRFKQIIYYVQFIAF